MLGKIILWMSTLAFVSYGVIGLIDPTLPAEMAGLAILSGDGRAELGAMYGGLQTAYGVFCLLGALRTDLYRPALTSLVLMMGGLAVARLYTAVMADGGLGGYTYGAMAFEFATAILSLIALRKSG